MHILVLGPSGQVGGMLLDELPQRLGARCTKLTSIGRRQADIELDITSQSEVVKTLNELKPDIIINAIAYTAVDKAESEPDLANKINADLPATLAMWCAENHVFLIHYSTDFVFSGDALKTYTEEEKTGPLSVYGHSKLAGEQAIKSSTASSIILRTSWVYGETGNNFMLTMQRFARERDTLGIVADQKGTPTYSRHLAILTAELILAREDKPEHFANKQHVYHASSSGSTTWHGFAVAIFDLMAGYESIKVENVNAIGTEDYPTPATRPANSVMSGAKLLTDLGLSMPDWHEGLSEAMRRVYSSDAA